MDLIKNEGQAQIQIIECGPEHDQINDSIFYFFLLPPLKKGGKFSSFYTKCSGIFVNSEEKSG